MPNKIFYNWVVALIIFSAPILTLTVPHGGTGNYFLLILIGMVTGWKQFRLFNDFEKYFWGGFLLLFLVNLVSFSQTENLSGGYTWLGKYLYLFLGVFAYAVIKEKFDFIIKYIDLFLFLNALLITFIASYQYFYLQIGRVFGNVHPILFGNITIALFGLILCRIFYTRFNWMLYLAMIFCFYSGALTLTRGALIAIPVVLTLLFIMTKAYKSTLSKITILLVAMLLIASITIDGSPIKERVLLYTIQDLKNYQVDTKNAGALTLRFEFWKNSLILLKDAPFIGIGPGDYNVEMKRLVDSGLSINKSEMNYLWTPHSNYVNALVTSGIVGLMAHIAAIFLIPLILLYRSKIPFEKSSYFIIVITSYFIFGLSTTWIATNSAYSNFMIFLLVSMSLMHTQNKKKDTTKVVV